MKKNKTVRKMKIQNERGVLMIIFIVGMVMSSMVITTAFFEIDRVVAEQRTKKTQEKMAYIMRGLGGDPFLVSNEGGSDINYVRENGGFPADGTTGLTAFIADGYLKNYGFASGSMAPQNDAFGRPIVFDTNGTTFRVYSDGPDDQTSSDDITTLSSGPGGVTRLPQMNEGMYEQVAVELIIEDIDGDEPFDTGPLSLVALYRPGASTSSTTFNFTSGRWYSASTVPVGEYVVKIVENQDTGTNQYNFDWMNTITGSSTFNVMTFPVFIGPESGSEPNEIIRIPYEILSA